MSVRGFTTLLHSANSTLPARRSTVAIAAAVALATGTLALGCASSAYAAPASGASTTGSASAVVLRTGLDVSLLSNTAHLPLNVSVNDVQAPADAHKTLLSAKLKGVDDGKQFNVLSAAVATSHATADAQQSQGYANLTHAVVHLPGLPMTGLVGVDAVTSEATCAVGAQPSAHITMAGNVTVLGKKVDVKTRGAIHVDVPGEGQVSLELAKKTTTSSTAAATALQLNVTVNPGHLNVAAIKGTVTLAQAVCQTPGTSGTGTGGSTTGTSGSAGSTTGASGSGGSTTGSSSTGGSATAGSTSGSSAAGGSGTQTQSGSNPSTQNLAETGSSSSTPYIAGAAALLVVGGGGVLVMSRRRKSQV
jgi:LPXTG-motif cell wall-anchored protein